MMQLTFFPALETGAAAARNSQQIRQPEPERPAQADLEKIAARNAGAVAMGGEHRGYGR